MHTPFCDLVGIDHPIVQAGMGPFTSPALVAPISNAGALGSLGTGARAAPTSEEYLAKIRELTTHPFAVNFTLSPALPDPALLGFVLKAKPRVISLALGEPDEYVKQAHDAGILVMHQVASVQHARRAADAVSTISSPRAQRQADSVELWLA